MKTRMINKHERKHLECRLEIKLAMKCYLDELSARDSGEIFKCKCIDPTKLSNSMLLSMLEEYENKSN